MVIQTLSPRSSDLALRRFLNQRCWLSAEDAFRLVHQLAKVIVHASHLDGRVYNSVTSGNSSTFLTLLPESICCLNI